MLQLLEPFFPGSEKKPDLLVNQTVTARVQAAFAILKLLPCKLVLPPYRNYKRRFGIIVTQKKKGSICAKEKELLDENEIGKNTSNNRLGPATYC